MNELTSIKSTLRNMIENRIGDIHVALPARIEKYDHQTMYATVVLLNKKKLGEEMVEIPPIVEVPVAHLNANMFVIRPPYKKGDIVQVVFNEKALDKLLITGKSEEVKLTRHHKIDDAVVVKGLKLESEPDLNSDYADDLLIENQDTGSRVVMKANGDMEVNVAGADTKTVDTTIDVTAGGSVTVNAADVTVNASITTVNGDATVTGTTNIGGGGPAVARLGDAVEVEVTGGSSAGTYVGEIIEGAGNSFAG